MCAPCMDINQGVRSIWIYPKIRGELSGIRESKEGNSIFLVSRVNVYGYETVICYPK